jgi:glycine C-acetyltransferase/8-amino-7-oxononanoate synthase
LQQVGRTYVRFQNRRLSYFSGCDYFRLSRHPAVLAALRSAVAKYGLNVAASRLTTGNHGLYRKLERRLAQFFDAPDALVVSSGYVTNLIVAQTLAGKFSHALLDAQCHPSLSDAARFLDCPLLHFKHRDPEDVGRAARRCGPGARLILLTDGMFASNGSVAPLADYLPTLPRDAWIMVDDSHGAGVIGRTGKGSLEHAGVSGQRIIQTITLSKAFGAFGGAILSNSELRRQILARSQLFIGSTPPPLPLANAAMESIKILKTRHSLRARLAANLNYVRKKLRLSGLGLEETPGPIIALYPKAPRAISRLTRRLLQAGIFPPFIRYPGGPAGGYFRFVISSEHTRTQLDNLAEALQASDKEMGRD